MTPPTNPFDQACRYLAKLDPEGFLGWALGLPPARFRFVRWLDTRQIPFPGEPDRVCDTVAFLEDVLAGGAPWAVPVEFSAEPDYRMFGRLLIYCGSLWLEVRPGPNKGDRFQLGAAVVNLTGTGRSSRDMRWPEAGLVTELRVAERNLAGESAAAVLSGVPTGTTSRVILPFVPLMHHGAEAGIIQGWLGLASAEPDGVRRGDYGGLALIFAEAADRADVWKDALKGWNVIQSKQVLEWQAEARAEGRAQGRAEGRAEGEARGLVEGKAAAVVEALEARFGTLPPELAAALRATTDLARLSGWLVLAVRCGSLDEFRRDAGV